MNERRLIDTNLVVRYLVQDHPQHAQAAAKLFEACDRGDVTLVLLPSVLSEIIFVLESFYKYPRGDIARVLGRLINSPGIEITDQAVYADALARYGKTNAHFVACTLAATAAAQGVPVASFDKDFKKFPDVQVVDPAKA